MLFLISYSEQQSKKHFKACKTWPGFAYSFSLPCTSRSLIHYTSVTWALLLFEHNKCHDTLFTESKDSSRYEIIYLFYLPVSSGKVTIIITANIY